MPPREPYDYVQDHRDRVRCQLRIDLDALFPWDGDQVPILAPDLAERFYRESMIGMRCIPTLWSCTLSPQSDRAWERFDDGCVLGTGTRIDLAICNAATVHPRAFSAYALFRPDWQEGDVPPGMHLPSYWWEPIEEEPANALLEECRSMSPDDARTAIRSSSSKQALRILRILEAS